MTVEKTLRDAYDAFDDSSELVLDHLLTAWRATRAAAIADAIDIASKMCRVGQQPLTGAKAAHKDEWDRVARLQHAADLDRLIESLVLREATLTKERVLLLQSWPANPRFTSLFRAHLSPRTFDTTREGRSFWYAIEDLLALMQDTRIPEQLRPLGTESARFRAKREQWLGERAELGDVERELLAKIVDRFNARAAQLSAADRRGPELLRKIYEAPDDDSPRIVYGDWLTERRDPRGEFIALQFERHAGKKISRANAARERALMDQHWETWLGGVRGFFRKDMFTFERGFLATAKLESVAPLRQPEWNTCRKIDFSRTAASPDGVLYLLSEEFQLRGLREIVGLASTVIERFATRRNEGGRLIEDPPSSRTRRDRGGNFTALRAGLERLEVRGPEPRHDIMLMLDLPRLRELVWTATGTPTVLFGALAESTLLPKLECVHYTDESSTSRVTLERDDSGLLKRVRLLNPDDQNRPSLETMCTSLGLSLIET